MKKILFALATTAAVLGFSAAASAQEKVKVCFVYVGSKTDGGWTQAHDIGRLELEKAFGDKIETQFLENVPEGPDAERAIERLARSGCGLIFTTSFGFMDATVKIAAKFPDVKFEHATGYKTAPNLATYNSRFYEGRYIQGQIAAKMSQKGVAGYIASFPIPEVVMGINSFVTGARTINPDFKIKVVWANTWFDPGKEADAAKALIDQGVDILDPAHRYHGSDAGSGRAGHQGVRPGLRHDQGRPENAADRDCRYLGCLLHQAHAGLHRRQVGNHVELGRPEGWHPDDGALHQHAG